MNIKNEIQIHFDQEGYINKCVEEQGVVCQNTFTRCGDNELMLEMEVFGDNVGETIDLEMIFSVSNSSLPIKPLQYCYPAREFVLSRENCAYNCAYGYRFPLSFVSLLNNENGITLIFNDQMQGSVGVCKQDDKFQFVVQYNQVPLQKGRRQIIIKFHSGDWHEGFYCYKSWYKNKYNELDKLDERLSDCFHIRRYFFNQQFCKNAIYNEGNYSFKDLFDDDQMEVGGVDAALLFDFAYSPQNNIRCGNAQPFAYLENLEELNRQLQACKDEEKLAVYAYFDPYLIQDGSDFDKAHRSSIPVLNQKGDRHYIWSKNQWHPCLSAEQWQMESSLYLTKVNEKLKIDGFYLDEVGNGEQFICHNDTHNHTVPLDQNQSENRFVSLLREKFPEKAFMCEFFPADSNISLFPSVLSDSKTIVDICRFAFPYKKIFKIIDCDRPIGNNTWDINKIFFNGMGLWLDNDLHNPDWYSPDVKKLITKHYQILKQYHEIFESNEVEPLVAASSNDILVNRFTKGNETIFTFLNVTTKKANLYFPFDEKYTDVFNIYNNKTCEIMIHHNIPSIKVELPPHEASCIYALAGQGDRNSVPDK